jgi:hypothetical protein
MIYTNLKFRQPDFARPFAFQVTYDGAIAEMVDRVPESKRSTAITRTRLLHTDEIIISIPRAMPADYCDAPAFFAEVRCYDLSMRRPASNRPAPKMYYFISNAADGRQLADRRKPAVAPISGSAGSQPI